MRSHNDDIDSSRSPDQGFATVVVGKTRKRFTIHQSLLMHYSTFFSKALDLKHEKNAVDLTHEEPQVFEFFVHWLYHQRFPDHPQDADELVDAWSKDKSNDVEDKGDTKTSNLIALYVFATKYNVPQLQTDALDKYFQHFQHEETSLPPIDAIRNAFENLQASSPLCQLLIDIQCCCKQHENWTSETAEWYPSTFLLGTLRRYAAIVQDGKQKRWWKLDLCDYHDHKDDEERADCKKEQRRRKRQARVASTAPPLS